MNKNTERYTGEDIEAALMQLRNEKQRQMLCRFFKTGPGEYGDGDQFLGLKCPQTRSVVKMAKLRVEFSEIEKLLYSPWHEVRLCGFLLLVEEMNAAIPKKRDLPTAKAGRREDIARFYLKHARQANNWDLVDMSCPGILGVWLCYPGENGRMPSPEILDRLADSRNLWEQRIAMVTNWQLIRAGRYDETIRIAKKLLPHSHDLIHKAVGWMLREMGKRDADLLRDFLSAHYPHLHRTTLRYAIEKFSPTERQSWLKRDIK